MKQYILSFLAFLTLIATTMAKVPEDVQGSWIVDDKATLAMMKRDPKWDAEAEKMAPMMIKMMSSMCLTFTTDSMIHSRGKKQEEMKVELILSKGRAHKFKTKTKNGKEVTFIIKVSKKGRMLMKSDQNAKMNHVVWKKGKPSENGQSEAEMMGEMMKVAVQDGLKKGFKSSSPTPAKKEKGPDKDFEEQWGGVKIHRLDDKAVETIKAMDRSKTSKIIIGKTCTQKSFNMISAFTWVTDVEFEFGNPNISSFESISTMTGLTRFKTMSLKKSKENAIDLKPLAKLTAMKELSLYGTKVKNTDVLSGMTKLKDVSLYMSAVDSIDFLKNTPDVETLSLYGFGHTFKDYQPLLNLKKLRKLNIYMNKQATDENLIPLAALTSFEEISMSNSKEVTTLAFLKGSKGLKRVSSSWAEKLSDISVMADMKDLQRVGISDAVVTDFSPLKGKVKLLDLDVSGTAFSDLAILKDSTDLQGLEIDETSVKDISYLKNFKKLRRLKVPKHITDDQIEELKKTHPNLRVRK